MGEFGHFETLRKVTGNRRNTSAHRQRRAFRVGINNESVFSSCVEARLERDVDAHARCSESALQLLRLTRRRTYRGVLYTVQEDPNGSKMPSH